MRRCLQCGATYDDGNSFCLKCGAMLVQEEGSGSPSKVKFKVNSSKIIVLLIVVMILASVLVVLYYPKTDETSDRLEFTWKYDGTEFTYKLDLNIDDYNKMMTSTIDRSGTTASDRYVIAGGTGEEVIFGVKDYIVVDAYIQKLVDDITLLYETEYGEGSSAADRIDYANYLLAFTQYIQYDDEEADSGDDYWRYPLETLYDGTGDCEDTSILAAAMYAAAEITAGIFLLPGHAMVSVEDSIGTIGEAVVHDNYYPGETTSITYIIGEISEAFDQSYFHLYTGYSTEYYYA